jgi:hypothetical protein
MRKTKTMGIRRIRLYKTCGHKLTPKNQKRSELEEQPATDRLPVGGITPADPAEPTVPTTTV